MKRRFKLTNSGVGEMRHFPLKINTWTRFQKRARLRFVVFRGERPIRVFLGAFALASTQWFRSNCVEEDKMKQASSGRFVATLSLLASVFALSASTAYATVIVGDLKITGVGAVAVTPTVIDFQPTVDPAGDGKGSTNGPANIVASSTGSFAGLVGTVANLRDISTTVVPVGGPTVYTDFITFASQPTWHITLTELQAGVFTPGACLLAPAAGQTCSIPGEPFNFMNTSATSSTVSASFLGIATDTATGEQTNVRGVLGATFSNLNFQQILAQGVSGPPVVTSFSGTITAVPEPSSASMMLIGALLVAGMVVGKRLAG